mmetsp:Transcript_5068/g.12712  ORF Transcript_5068/g.12712 Transcript_5068/m.12712 type:complete len:224 (+) Transcript_5068:1295-1966(+)
MSLLLLALLALALLPPTVLVPVPYCLSPNPPSTALIPSMEYPSKSDMASLSLDMARWRCTLGYSAVVSSPMECSATLGGDSCGASMKSAAVYSLSLAGESASRSCASAALDLVLDLARERLDLIMLALILPIMRAPLPLLLLLLDGRTGGSDDGLEEDRYGTSMLPLFSPREFCVDGDTLISSVSPDAAAGTSICRRWTPSSLRFELPLLTDPLLFLEDAARL